MIIPLTKILNFVEGPERAKYPYCNCLFINDEKRAVIDTNCGQEDIDFLKSQGIDVIINSHFHEDHILNNHAFPKAEVWAHRLDAEAIRSPEALYDYYGFRKGLERDMAVNFIENTLKLKASPIHREIEDGDVLSFGKVSFTVILTPGHTPGHCAFFEEKENILFCADIALTDFPPWYGHPCSSIDDFITSIEKCRELKPELVLTSHGSGIVKDDIPGRFNRYLDMIYIKEDQVRNALAERPMTLDELAQKHIYYGDFINKDPFLPFFEKMIMEQHLIRLMRLKEVRVENGIYYRC